MIFIELRTRRCSSCDQRRPTKGGTFISGKFFVCSECAKSIPAAPYPAKKRKKDNVSARREAMKIEVAESREIHQKKEGDAENRRLESIERKDLRYADTLASVMEKLRGDEYKAWYEATTGENVSEFIHRIENPIGFKVGKFGSMWRQKMCERISNHVQVAASKNPWTNPENRVFLAKEVAECKRAKDRRTIMQRLATPRWADAEKVVEIYRERNRIVKETGIPHDVDHIVPIINRLVCGLHCEFNLRVIPASENRSKSNRFEIT